MVVVGIGCRQLWALMFWCAQSARSFWSASVSRSDSAFRRARRRWGGSYSSGGTELVGAGWMPSAFCSMGFWRSAFFFLGIRGWILGFDRFVTAGSFEKQETVISTPRSHPLPVLCVIAAKSSLLLGSPLWTHKFPVPVAPSGNHHPVMAETGETAKAPRPAAAFQFLGNLAPAFVYGPVKRLKCSQGADPILLHGAAARAQEQSVVELFVTEDFGSHEADQFSALGGGELGCVLHQSLGPSSGIAAGGTVGCCLVGFGGLADSGADFRSFSTNLSTYLLTESPLLAALVLSGLINSGLRRKGMTSRPLAFGRPPGGLRRPP